MPTAYLICGLWGVPEQIRELFEIDPVFGPNVIEHSQTIANIIAYMSMFGN